MGAVGPAPDPVLAVQQGGLRSLAADVVQQDQTHALAKRPVQDDLGLTPEGAERVRSANLKLNKVTFTHFVWQKQVEALQ